MFETLLASTGIGSSRIDLILDKGYVKIGDKVTGKIVIKGGESKQQIEGLTVNFKMESVHAVNPTQIHETIETIQVIQDEFTIYAKEEKTISFTFICPHSVLVSSSTTKYYFDTDLEIKWGLDSHDRDYIDVWPQEPLQHFLESFTLLDFKKTWEGLYKEEDQWVQLFIFQPTALYSGQISKLIVSLKQHNEQQIQGYYQLDHTHRDQTEMIQEIINIEESNTSLFTLTDEQLATCELAAQQLKELIQRKI